jgi:hypothetical protein
MNLMNKNSTTAPIATLLYMIFPIHPSLARWGLDGKNRHARLFILERSIAKGMPSMDARRDLGSGRLECFEIVSHLSSILTI